MQQRPRPVNYLLRVRIWHGVLIAICMIFLLRLFYLQVIRHDFYRTQAKSGQMREKEIPAERGVIYAYNGNQVVPLVLNETKYTVFADPQFIDDPSDAATKIQAVIGGNIKDIEAKMRLNSRYSVLAKKVNKKQKEEIEALKIKGIGVREERYRAYPQNELAAHILGFVNDEGEGKYGIEQYWNNDFKGVPGQLKAVTDANGIPLIANKDNIINEPIPGKSVILTIDVSMQKQLEDYLRQGVKRANAKSGGAFIMEVQTGAIKAMANYPSYNPAKFYEVTDSSRFNNNVVATPLEPGSVMKPLTTAAALDQGVIKPNQTYYDPGQFRIDNATVRNVEEAGGAGQRAVVDILRQSLNTGATWLLMQMGGGNINERARTAWYDYMTKHYNFGKITGIEQGFEATGTVPAPNEGFGLNIQYANTSFGQGMTVTPLQMGAALSSVLNGGTYYQPRLIDTVINADGSKQKIEPKVLHSNVVKPSTSKTLQKFMESVVQNNYLIYGFKSLRPQYMIGGKTGTAQITKPDGGYYENRFNGMFTGFVGGDKPQYVIVVRVDEPHVVGYAGSKAAGPIFVDLANMLIDNFNVLPKSR